MSTSIGNRNELLKPTSLKQLLWARMFFKPISSTTTLREWTYAKVSASDQIHSNLTASVAENSLACMKQVALVSKSKLYRILGNPKALEYSLMSSGSFIDIRLICEAYHIRFIDKGNVRIVHLRVSLRFFDDAIFPRLEDTTKPPTPRMGI